MFNINIEKKTISNKLYRNVLYTNNQSQLVVMNLLPNEEIGMEKHHKISQFFRIEEGSGHAIVAGKRIMLKAGSSLIVDANTYHNIIAGKSGLKFYSIYSPPKHNPDCKQKRKEDPEC